jgi:hypothetical protein
MTPTIANSSAEIVTFEPGPQPEHKARRPTFAQASKAWLRALVISRHVTDAEARVCAALFPFFNNEHYELTGELEAWPAWETLMAESGKSKATVDRALRKLERIGALEIEHGRYDDVTKRRAGNRYHVPLNFLDQGLTSETLRPDQGLRARSQSKVSPVRQDSVSRLGESDSVRKKERIKIGNSRKDGEDRKPESKRSEKGSPSNSKSSEPVEVPHPPSSAGPPLPLATAGAEKRRKPRQRLSNTERRHWLPMGAANDSAYGLAQGAVGRQAEFGLPT